MITFDKNTKAIVYGENERAIQTMLDFDSLCSREPSVEAIVTPFREGFHKAFYGKGEVLIPIYKRIGDAAKQHSNAEVFINYASSRSAYSISIEALNEESIKVVIIIAEGVPEKKARGLWATAKERKKLVIGPSTVGGVTAGQFRIGEAGGTIENIIKCKLHKIGSVGLVSRSGGMLNELFNIIARNCDGVYEGVAVGGDRYPGSTLLDHLLRYEENPNIKFSVMLGEVGKTTDEYDVAQALKEGRLKKPVVAWTIGTSSELFPSLQFGHAAAKAEQKKEFARAKNSALLEAGAIVPESFNDLGEKIKETYLKYGEAAKIKPQVETEVDPSIFKNRKETHFICTISDDRGEEAEYCGIPISELFTSSSLGEVIGLLWFKKKLPKDAAIFLEKILLTIADHGPAVSGAHNSIVAARAGKDVISSLVSGLLTIGPRFGGAINDAACRFKEACDKKMTPIEFVEKMKAEGEYIPGIGHRIKSVDNPDRRVELIKQYAKEHFKKTTYIDYALEVEKITTAKRNNLILNVDGCIGVALLDMFKYCNLSDKEIDEMLKHDTLNAFFVLGRSIGLIGHVLDQYRLRAGLYRHPQDDILYKKD